MTLLALGRLSLTHSLTYGLGLVYQSSLGTWVASTSLTYTMPAGTYEEVVTESFVTDAAPDA